eukprot:TRINITY_DN6397_c0_g1_i5.p1 TRINITY_DN6397_c0_g1~~TRINITY_DN6397_c0_g1_i5.p1  ORF type:complete len:677 (+),score=113.11 TRINITY_DN6397_c0_g1_i5:110-2140(+)
MANKFFKTANGFVTTPAVLRTLALLLVQPDHTVAFSPIAVDYHVLIAHQTPETQHQLWETFKVSLGVDGMIAIRGIPGFQKLREQALLGAHACMAQAPPRMQSVTLPDGTYRQTLAAVSSAFSEQAIDHGSESDACRAWSETSDRFREAIGTSLNAFVKHLSHAFGDDVHGPLLHSVTGKSYNTLEQVVRSGERLEHFHSYNLPEVFKPLTDYEGRDTIEFHVDQGVFIAFVPSVLVDTLSKPVDSSTPHGTFKLKSADGTEKDVHFQPDSLIIMPGDGINHFFNARRKGLTFHAPPHAFQMSASIPELHRLWYGLMQLLPADAKNEESGLTYGEIRSQVVGLTTSPEESSLGLGCSRKLTARELMSTCSENQMYCWHRCMNFTDDVSPQACAAKSFGFNCTSQFDQIYLPKDGHGDYNLACTNSTELVSARPPVEQPTAACRGWQDLVSDPSYTHRVTLSHNETYFLWNVEGDGKTVHGKMIHRGLVGWLALGIENIGGEHNGMNGASVVMGHNLQGSSRIGEYRIHKSMTAFRHWKEPLDPPALADAAMTLTNCYSSMVFKAQTIYGKPLNVSSGTDRLIWALSRNAYVTDNYGGYAPYHTDEVGDPSQRTRFRGKVHLDFTSGAMLTTTTAAITASGEDPQQGEDTSDARCVMSSSNPIAMLLLASIICLRVF